MSCMVWRHLVCCHIFKSMAGAQSLDCAPCSSSRLRRPLRISSCGELDKDRKTIELDTMGGSKCIGTPQKIEFSRFFSWHSDIVMNSYSETFLSSWQFLYIIEFCVRSQWASLIVLSQHRICSKNRSGDVLLTCWFHHGFTMFHPMISLY